MFCQRWVLGLAALLCLIALSRPADAIDCYYCGNKKDCDNPRKTQCDRGSCAKIERGESLQKGCYTMGSELRLNQEERCFVDMYQRNVCTCNSDFCNSALTNVRSSIGIVAALAALAFGRLAIA